MFTKPIRWRRLRTVEELKMFSHFNGNGSGKPKTYCRSNGEFVFCDENEHIWVTPYRSEIPEILKDEGYKQNDIDFYYPKVEDVKECYDWLRRIADEENWAETYENAYLYAQDKGIMSVELQENVQVKEIKRKYEDNHRTYMPMIEKFLSNPSWQNIGTYIYLDDKSVLVCDEYGRTFLISVKTTINSVVNALIDAGYTRTPAPWIYVKENNNIE